MTRRIRSASTCGTVFEVSRRFTSEQCQYRKRRDRMPFLRPNVPADYVPGIDYLKHTISDEKLRGKLREIAKTIGFDIKIKSGDRCYSPKGSAKGSLHLKKRAADIQIDSHSYLEAFMFLRNNKDAIFFPYESYQIILHGKYTCTEAEHIHIGRYEVGDKDYGKGILFFVEGITQEKRKIYDLIDILPCCKNHGKSVQL